MSNVYESMGKIELRARCKESGIKNYGKMTVNDMRAALTAYDNVIAQAETVDIDSLGINGLNGHCPHCKINHIENGYNTHDDTAADHGIPYAVEHHPREYSCLACNGEWGKKVEYDEALLTAEVAPEVEATGKASTATGTGLPIQKDRVERNGIKRPSVGGKCDAVWSYCDSYLAEHGKTPMPKDMRAWAEAHGQNPSNAVIELYQWRKWVA